MGSDNILRTFADSSRKESVLPLVEILTAEETWFLNNLGKTRATDTIHSTLTDTLRTAASAAVSEAADYSAGARTTPSKVQNIVEKVAIPFKVSQTEQAVERYVKENELSRQTSKAIRDWALAAEFDLVRSTLTSGVSGTTPTMSGIIEAISTSDNVTSHTSSTTFSASIIRGLMKTNWDNSNGDVVSDIFMGSYLSNAMDSFTNKSYTVVNGSNETSVVHSVDLYETGLGKVRKHTHRYVYQSGDGTGRVLGVRPEKLKIAYLIQPFVDKDLARSGPYDFYAVTGDLTLEVRNKKSNFFADGFDITT